MSTQILTELPNIQKAGMDFETVMKELHNIITENPNWNSNWTEFLDSEAGTMLIQIMSWIADNLATRQDIIHNEMFIGTAQKAVNKIRHLKHIGYVPQMPHSAKAPVTITFDKVTSSNILVTPPRDRDLLLRRNQICSFEGKDINGKPITWELIKFTDGKPDYLNSIILAAGDVEYKRDKQGNELYAVQGRTEYKEFTTTTSDGPYFNINVKNIASDSVQVYIKKDASKLIEVNSFVSKDALDPKLPIPYVFELNEDMTYRIRFGNKGIMDKSRLLPAGTTISVFYRTSEGSKGNIAPGFINKTYNFTGENGNTYKSVIKNETLGFGGTDQETLDQAVLNGPLSLRTMDRAVTPEDYNIILGRNTSIFKVKTYTSSNQPAGFRKYYGRYINPQESFSFVMLNKNYDKVPASKYNYFPWMSSNKEPRLNEKYVFDHGSYNHPVDVSDTSYNVKLTLANGVNEMFFRNFTVLDLGEEWNNSIYDDSGELNTYLKGKIGYYPTDKKFYDDINFSLLGSNVYSSIGTKDSKGNRINYYSYDDNARFLTRGEFKLDVPIDVRKARRLTIVVNGLLSVTVDLWGALQFNEDKMPEHAYLKWSNTPKDDKPIKYADISTKDAANYRYGIVEIINMSLNDAIESDERFINLDKVSRQYYGLSGIISPDTPTLFNIAPNPVVPVCIKIKGNTYVFKLFKDYSDANEMGTWGSLKALANYLNYVFMEGQSSEGADAGVKKLKEDGSLVDIEFNELANYRAEAAKRTIFDSDYADDDDVGGFGSTRELFDLVISNLPSAANELTTLTFDDKYSVSHTLNKVIDVQDPLEPVTVSAEDTYNTLGYITKGHSCNRLNGTIPNPTQAAEYKNLASIQESVKIDSNGNILPGYEDKLGYGRLKIASPTEGETSTICFMKQNSSNEDDTDFGSEVLGIKYPNDEYSEKAYGVRRLYLVEKKALSVTKVENGILNDVDVSVNGGNIIFENSCIYNEPDFENLYCNYKVKSNNSLRLGSVYNNFFYTGNATDELLKEDVSGIVGQYVDYSTLEDGTKSYRINEEKSKLDVRFTSDIQKTNSLYPIVTDLDVIQSDRVKITTNSLNNFKSTNCKLIMQIDNEPELSISLLDCHNSDDIYNAIKQSIKLNGSSLLRENVDTVISQSYLDGSKLIIQSIDKNAGLIKFIIDPDVTQEENNSLYLQLFGNDKVNSMFYKTYVKSEDVRSDNVILVNEKDNNYYYYVPKKEKPLGFNFKKLVNIDGRLVSRYPDYYIDIVEYPLGNQFKYDFSIVKTENSRFPDREFYVHFVNDKSFQFDEYGKKKENDETVLQNYMYKYKISGTDITFYQPYFKTYDIAATIKYNANFSETEIVQNVRKAIDNVCDLKYSEIAGTMSQAKIFKAIMNCSGVTDCKIRYFGEDYKSRKGNVDTIAADFYEILCIHEDQGEEHGKILTFEVSD